jgi:hypothetical protein
MNEVKKAGKSNNEPQKFSSSTKLQETICRRRTPQLLLFYRMHSAIPPWYLCIMKTETKQHAFSAMQPYVDYLLADISGAMREKSDVEDVVHSPEEIRQRFEEMERMLETPTTRFSQLCGLQKEQFPPAERLSVKQLREICNAFHNLLESWNLAADIPKKVPAAQHYALLVSILDEETHEVKYGTTHFDFCTGNWEGCELGKHCVCRRYHTERATIKKRK